ncbi:hypothetical protein [Anaerocolumna sp. MB42-C2]|uniref:glycoside hydrolase family 38 N-terminal domain-containing protein n=1 Tax=Anaerocolumna sp. MB42-C2 TaxID=3070997 RepID=UPI0027DF1F56|nr:hypothetical protein [Anaerocolumna sp. MB42-C2]WMJ90600.1 hypothetical protein RBU59_14020 [Anaerocolumna sp. MB42-C2]
MVKKFILVFKTHFDIGFTDLSSKVIDKYSNSMLEEVIATCNATEHMGALKYVWTMPSWPLKVITKRCREDLKKELDRLIEQGQIVWHALPFTSHTDFCSAEEYIETLRFGKELSEAYHKPYVVSAKMTDVPGHSIMLPAILSGAGVKFLHLGCNEFATPPKVPFLFNWQAKSGEKLLTMYSKGGYGTSLFPPKDWDYPVWMALMQTNDNSGPQSASVIEKLAEKVRSKYPDAKIVCGTMDAFYYELSKCDLSKIPTITKDLGDTWIHGVGSYPKEVGMIREDRERNKRLQAIYAKQLLNSSLGNKSKIAELQNQYYENVGLFEEHTWGADVKTWLGPERVYQKSDFLKAKENENYQFMETSWKEQRDRANICNITLGEIKSLIENKESGQLSVFNPGGCDFTGWVIAKDIDKDFTEYSLEMNCEKLPVTKINGEWAFYVKNLRPFVTAPITVNKYATNSAGLCIKKDGSVTVVENHRYSLTFSEITGKISEVYDKKLKTVLLKQQKNESVFAYRYDRYGIEEVTQFLREYAYRFSAWGIQDYGREAYPECDHKTFYPVYQFFTVEQNTLVFHYINTESAEEFGDAKEIKLEITLPPAGDELFVTLRLKDKQETPFIESGSFMIPIPEKGCRYRVNKPNAVLNPEKDIEENANHVFYSLENYISASDDNNGVCVIPMDSPLTAIGSTGVYEFRKEYKAPDDPVLYFNLFNNMWGTNFPQWTGGDLCYRYILYGFDQEKEKCNLEKAAMLKMGAEITGNTLTTEDLKLPEHMQLINAREDADGIVIRLKDLMGEEAVRKIVLNGYVITPIDLYNRVTGEKNTGEYTFTVKSYGIYSFLLSRN